MNGLATKRKHTLARIALLGLAGTLSIGAQAGEPQRPDEVTSSVKVSYADLDLTDAAGARTLYARIRSAAGKVCGPEPAALDLRAATAYRNCYEQAVARAVNRVGSDQLQVLHATRSGRSTAG